MIQLKIRTEYSFGKTFAPVAQVVAYLKAHGCVAAGIVDGSTWGHVAWVKACQDAGIQPLLGVECVVNDGDDETTMWFLAVNTAGLSELYQCMTGAHVNPIKTKRGSTPRMRRLDVECMSENILKFAGMITDAEWLQKIGAYADIDPTSLVRNHKKLDANLPLVNVGDNAYIQPDDEVVFEVMARAGRTPTPQHILLDLQETDAMREIVERCKGLALPVAPMIHMEGDLEALCRDGIKRRGLWKTFQEDPRYETRLQYELDIIKQKDYQSYFIVVADMVRFAKQHMLVGPSRGSAAGSLVCYLAHITEVDPIPPGLFFERFIDITRRDLPDIDLDFPDEKRHLVFEYMAEKYGQRKVAHIGTILKFKPKSALGHVCKALGIPEMKTSGVKAAMIVRSSADSRANACLMDTLQQTEPGKAFLREFPHAAICGQLEGHASHTGTHAAGLLICNNEITNYCTVDAQGIAHIEMSGANALGLLKIDVLGLRTLSVLEDSGVKVDWYKLPLDDPKMFEVFNTGRLCGIFQFEGQALRSITSQMTVGSIADVDAITALARPGPFAGGVTQSYLQRRNGQSYVPIHPLVQEHMQQSYGLPIYQEQTLAICREIGNFGWKEAAIIRKAMSKSLGVEFFNQYWEMFKEGAATHGMNETDARRTWEMIMTMGSWQMNKAHTYSYAVISCWCAWLKAHHPLEFAAAMLRSAITEETAISLLREMVREGIEYIPFDPDLSEINWSVKHGKLVGGFTAVKGIGVVKAKKYVAARDAGKMKDDDRVKLMAMPNPFNDIFPFTKKYADIYKNPLKYGISLPLRTIDEVLKEKPPHGHERAMLVELIYKNPRDVNDPNNVKKRNGEIITEGCMEYLDMKFQDDTGNMGGRVVRQDYMRMGLPITENVPIGTHLLVRAKFFTRDGEFIPWAFIQNWKPLTEVFGE